LRHSATLAEKYRNKNTLSKNYCAKNLVNFRQGTLPWQPILWRETARSWHKPPLLFVLAFYNG